MEEVLKPTCLEEACNFVSELGNAVFVAGATEEKQSEEIEYFIDLTVLKDLSYIKWNGTNQLKIGALTSMEVLAQNDVVKEWFPGFQKICEIFGNDHEKKRGTLGGKIAARVPQIMDELQKLNVKIHIQGADHGYNASLQEFLEEQGHGILDPDEIITEIVFLVNKEC